MLRPGWTEWIRGASGRDYSRNANPAEFVVYNLGYYCYPPSVQSFKACRLHDLTANLGGT
jgi:hypothetical protein